MSLDSLLTTSRVLRLGAVHFGIIDGIDVFFVFQIICHIDRLSLLRNLMHKVYFRAKLSLFCKMNLLILSEGCIGQWFQNYLKCPSDCLNKLNPFLINFLSKQKFILSSSFLKYRFLQLIKFLWICIILSQIAP